MTAAQPVLASTANGDVRGHEVADGVWCFRGIPYAAAPVGDRRFRAPQPVEPWAGIRDATEFASDAIQPVRGRTSRAPGMSEDCLYLNVWTPAQSRTGGWPVVVWSGGGGFVTGGGSFVEEDPARLAARGLVVVTFNYRLGVFGFLAHAALSADSPDGTSGNYGLADHVAALRWVRTNVAAFGGDGDRVTYLGESSGAAAGLLLLGSSVEQRLFDRGVFWSPGSTRPLLPLAEAEASASTLELTADELRQLPADELVAASKQIAAGPSNLNVARPLRPIADGTLITADDTFDTGEFDPVPVIIGSNEDEGRFFTGRLGISTVDDYASYLDATFGPAAGDAAKHYPATTDSEVPIALADVYGDVSINHPIDRLARAFAARQPDTYRAVYTYRHGASTEPPTHSEEAASLLDSRGEPTPRDSEMSAVIAQYLATFAEHGAPAASGGVGWPRFDGADEQYLRLDLPVSTGARWRADQLGFVSAAFSAGATS